MRSHFGCVTCKQRKLKCDEKKPICSHCARTHRSCAYAIDAQFREEALPSLDGQVWLHVPRQLTFIHVEDPYEDEYVAESGFLPPKSHISTPSRRTNDFTKRVEDAPTIFPQPVADNINELVGPGDCISINPCALQAYLLWHFKQGPSQWMDLFDTQNYFSGQVSMMAAKQPMLLSAICALSAKRLSRESDFLGNSSRRQTPLDQSRHAFLGGNRMNWHYQTIQFYDEAIRQVKEAIAPDSVDSGLKHNEELSENILETVAILSMFELMDAPGIEWRAHLGALPLFNEASSTQISLQSPSDSSRDHKKRSLFWSFARQDVISAFVHEKQTFLDLEDSNLWHRFGLSTGDFGISMLDQELSHFSPPETWAGNCLLPEESVSNALTWILGRIINFITSGDSLDPLDFSSPARRESLFSVSQEALSERWCLLENDLRRWYNARPSTFNPCARARCMAMEDEPAFEGIWYTIPMCAAAMQTYHMARILLLMNRPQESTAVRSTVTARLKSYRDTERQVLNHSREICGISLSMPPETVRVHSLQPLFVSGQCFSGPNERHAVIDLLVGVEKDLGWASKYYVDKLREEWRRADEISGLSE